MILLLRRRTKMAKVTVKLFGVLRMDTKLKAEEINIYKVEDIFDSLNLIVDERFEENKKSNPLLPHPDKLSFKDAVIFINGERCAKKSKKLSDGDEVWLLSPASGG